MIKPRVKELKLHNLFFALISCLLIFIGVLSFILIRNANALEQLENNRYKLYALGMELKESSESLTKFCRTYVLTGDSSWEQKYWELLDIRNGKKTRPDGHTIALKDSLLRLGISTGEYKKLALAEKISNELVWTEKIAFHAMKGLFADKHKHFTIKGKPDTALARKIVFDEKYHANKEKIMHPIEEFRFMLDERISSSIKIQKLKNNLLLTVIIITILVISLLSFYAILVLRKKIILQIEDLEISHKKIKQHEEKLIIQNKELDSKVEKRNKELNIKYQELVHSQEEIKARKSELKAFFESVDSGASLLDTQKRYVIFNKRFVENHQFLTGKTLMPMEEAYTHFPKEMKDQRLKLLDSVLLGNKEIIETTQTRDNRQIYFRTSFSPVITDGKVTGIAMNTMDLTSIKETEIALRQSENKFRDLVEKNLAGVYILDVTAEKLLYASPKFLELFGYEESETERIIPYDLIHPEDQNILEQNIKQITRDGAGTFQYTAKAKRKNKEDFWLEVFVNSTTYNGKLATIGTVIEITERKLMELEREKIIKDLHQRNLDLEQFAYIISHNLRLPVANILGIAEILKNDNLKKEQWDKFLSYLHLSTKKLDEIVSDLNRVLNVRMEIHENRETMRFSDLTEDIKNSIHNTLQQEDAKITTDFSAAETIYTLKSYMHSIFYNLITNSVKYRQKDKPLLITIKSETDHETLRLSFKDNGSGIDLQKNKDKVFGLYKRFHSNVEGKGMGLFMVKTQVESLGGKISINSIVNEGTEFIIEFEKSKLLPQNED